MDNNNLFDVLIIGGSYSGLAAAMALGRALRKVLVIDDGKPCNRQTPHSHNFLTQDGTPPDVIAAVARKQVEAYNTIQFLNGRVVSGEKKDDLFSIQTDTGDTFRAANLIFATGIRDILPPVKGLAECWGISALHCPYCHGYEVRNKPTALIANDEIGFEMAGMIANWTSRLSVFTNGPATFSEGQLAKLAGHHIKVVETPLAEIEHNAGQIRGVIFADGAKQPLDAVYVRVRFEQHCTIPAALGCRLNEEGYIMTDALQATTVEGIYACGDNAGRNRTVANAVGSGTLAGMAVSRKIITGNF